MIKKIRTEDLKIGMFIDDFNVPWMDHPFMGAKKRLKNPKEIDLILKHNIKEVYIDTSKGVDSPDGMPAEESQKEIREEIKKEVIQNNDAEEEKTPQDKGLSDMAAFKEELKRAKQTYSEAKILVKDLLQDARMGKSIDGERAAKVVDNMVDSIFRNKDALTSLSRLKSFDDYTFQHSLNVSVLALSLGRHLGLVKGELKRLGIGSILHDVGKMRVPEHILNKPGRFTDEEFEIMKTHTIHGAKILADNDKIPKECASVALNHHERFNGRGYPRGTKGLSIGKFGLISSIVDVYDAITSDRVYHKGMPNHQALQKIYEWAKTDFYPIYVQKFIQCLGIYPVGAVVCLDTHELGVVFMQNHAQLLRPWIKLVRDASGAPVENPFDVDLSDPDPNGQKEFARTITGTVEAKKAGLDVDSLLYAD